MQQEVDVESGKPIKTTKNKAQPTYLNEVYLISLVLFTAKFSSADAFALVSFSIVSVPLQLYLITEMLTQIYTLVIQIKIRQKLPQRHLLLIIQSQLFYLSLTYLSQALDQLLTLK
jgi:hypothetical protein